MEMSTSLHQDIDEFYDNITDTLLDEDIIALYIKSLFEIPVIGINRRLKFNDIKIKRYMDRYHSKKVPVSPLNHSSVVNINSIVWCHVTSNINKENMVCGKCQNKDGVHQTKFIENFPKHFLLLFERNQYNFRTKYSKLVETRIKSVNNLNLSFCSMRIFVECLIISPSYLQLFVRVEEVLTKVTLLCLYLKKTKSYCTMIKK